MEVTCLKNLHSGNENDNQMQVEDFVQEGMWCGSHAQLHTVQGCGVGLTHYCTLSSKFTLTSCT